MEPCALLKQTRQVARDNQELLHVEKSRKTLTSIDLQKTIFWYF